MTEKRATFLRVYATALILALTLIILLPAAASDASAVFTASAVADTSDLDIDIDAVTEDTAAWLLGSVPSPGIGQTGGEWAVIALARSGAEVPDSYFSAYYNKVADQLEVVKGLLSTVKYSEYSRVALAIAAIGADPRDVGGYDMLAPLFDFSMTVNQGLNGPIFALIALGGTGGGNEPVTKRYIDFILARQLDDGGFTLSGSISDPDTTAMALTALSRYRSREDVAEATDRAVERLSRLQRANGGFSSFSSVNSESVSQVIIALCSLGVPVDDERFVKNGNSLVDNLLSYRLESGGFEHGHGGGGSLMATEQALCALAALRRYRAGQNPIYEMSDAPAFVPGEPGEEANGAHPDVCVPGDTGVAAGFTDISGHINEAAIRGLTERGIITGYSPEIFVPDGVITRAESAAILVRALGLGAGIEDPGFSDVPAGSWFFDYARAACGYGIIEGRSADIFDPGALINRQEAAVMLCRAASLCGMRVTLDDTAVRNILAPFIDYRRVADWAATEVAFCFYTGISDDGAIEIMPSEHVTRGEAAEMVFRMLRLSGLI